MVALTGLIVVTINFDKSFAKFLTDPRKFVFAKFFCFGVCKNYCSTVDKTFCVKIETVFLLKKNIFLDKLINAN